MKYRQRRQLKNELHDVGATSQEIKELLPIALELKSLKTLPSANANNYLSKNTLAKVLKPSLVLGIGAVVGMAIVILSQSVLPSSWAYPVQKLSDHVAIAIHPEYRATVMMHRALQVNQLVATHAQPRVIIGALNDYNSEAAAYKSTANNNYASLEYCKTNLQAAATTASRSVHQAIVDSLHSLQDV